jgi:hypothetical protein
VFVAGDLLWYAVEGDPTVRTAPDVMVAFGRPKGDRGSYKQWLEGGVAPQVVFEINSPGNRPDDTARKFAFYEEHGVEEYYFHDPHDNDLRGWVRQADRLAEVATMDGWVSPILGVRFELDEETLRLIGPDGVPFETYVGIGQARDAARRRAEDERRRAEDAERRAEEERLRAERLAERLRAL